MVVVVVVVVVVAVVVAVVVLAAGVFVVVVEVVVVASSICSTAEMKNSATSLLNIAHVFAEVPTLSPKPHSRSSGLSV